MPRSNLGRDRSEESAGVANKILEHAMLDKNHMTQDELAKVIKISHGSIGNKLKCHTSWKLEELYRAFDYFKISNEDILKIFGRKVSKT